MTRARSYLSRFQVRAYRSCKSVSLELNPDITALIGPNGSGKTNLLKAITLLQTRRGPQRRPSKELSPIKCQIEADFSVRGRPVLFKATVFIRHNEQNEDEILYEDNEWNFQSLTGRKAWVNANLEEIPWADQLTLRRFEVPKAVAAKILRKRRGEMSKAASDAARRSYNAVTDLCSSISYYGASQFTKPGLCPTAFETSTDGSLLETSPRNDHVKFMYDLHVMKKQNPELYENYMSLLDRRGLNLIDRIAWRTAKFSSSAYEVKTGGKVQSKKTGKVLIIPTIHISKSQLSFNQLSEGTFRTLALIFYIVTDKSRIILIEEPEVCIHHGLLSSIIQVIKTYSHNKQIILSTHSEAVVDQLTPSNLRIVENSKVRGTTVSPISEAMSVKGYAALKNYLEKTGNLGEYWTHSGFDK
jgi:ABC-type Mn2+/Zn2+ transport system ATPase subunit